jgi:hypothetical protein
MPEFNLVDQPWIPCLLRDGGKPQELRGCLETKPL